LRVRELAADPRRIDRFASGRRLRPGRESAHRIGARSVTQTPGTGGIGSARVFFWSFNPARWRTMS
ncbi:MAG: hypothetical protein ACK6D2_11935, partial [Planctomycetota bacterium]